MNTKYIGIAIIGSLSMMVAVVTGTAATDTEQKSQEEEQTEYFYYSSVEGKVPLNLTVDKLGLRFRKNVSELERDEFYIAYSEITPVQAEVSLTDVDCTLVQLNNPIGKDSLKSLMEELEIQPEIEFIFPVFHRGNSDRDFVLTDKVSVVADTTFNKIILEDLFAANNLIVQETIEYKRIGKTAFRLLSNAQRSFQILQAANSIDNYAKGIHAAPVFISLIPNIELHPNDPLYDDAYSNGWHLFNTRINPPFGPDHINADAGWNIEIGDMNIVIAVLDTGIDLDHDDLLSNIWINEDEIQGNLIDDDENGFVDDINGWDIVNDDNDPSDDHEIGHGTMVSGVADAVTNNETGVAGTAWNCTIMPVKEHYADGSNTPLQNANGITYAMDNGAHIINISSSWETDTPEEEAVINEARSSGILIVAATGNQNDDILKYPAGYPGVMAIGGSNFCGERWRFIFDACNAFSLGGGSNIGPYVDVIAPATQITTTKKDNQYLNYKDGTSLSTPQVAGLAALIHSANLNEAGHTTLSPVQVQAYIQFSAYDCIYSDWFEDAIQGRDEYTGYGRIDVYQALIMSKESKFSLHDSDGPALFSLDQNGNIIIDGSVCENTDANSLWCLRSIAGMNGYQYIHAKDSTGASLMHVDNHIRMSTSVDSLYGRHLWLRSKMYRMKTTLSVTPPDGSLIIRNSTGIVIGFLNSTDYSNDVPYIDLQGNNVPINSTISAGSLAIRGRAFIGGDPDRLSSQGNSL